MLKEYREKKGLTQKEMAEMLGVSVVCYNRYEKHQRKISYELLIMFLEIRNEEYDKIMINMLKSI